MIQRVEVESLASVVAEKLPKLPVAAEAGGLDVAGEAFLGEKRGGGGGVDGARFGGSWSWRFKFVHLGSYLGDGKEKVPFRE